MEAFNGKVWVKLQPVSSDSVPIHCAPTVCFGKRGVGIADDADMVSSCESPYSWFRGLGGQ